MELYLDDRRGINEALAEIRRDVTAVRQEVERRAGREDAEEAGVESRRKFVREVGLCLLSAGLGIASTFGATVIS